MPESSAKRVTSAIPALRKSLETEHGCDSMQLDYELKLVLFLSAMIDGGLNAAEKSFCTELAAALGWSAAHERLLDGKILAQPSYDSAALRFGSGGGDQGRRAHCESGSGEGKLPEHVSYSRFWPVGGLWARRR